MSKDADKDVVESAGSQRARRRRKKSGLRIPSDNVPRSTPSAPLPAAQSAAIPPADGDFDESDGIVAPIPEDPDVAVAVAYTFRAGTDGGTGQGRAGSQPAMHRDSQHELDSRGERDSQGEIHDPDQDDDPDDDEDLSEEVDLSSDDDPGSEDMPAEIGQVAADQDEEDDIETRKTRRMPAVQLHELGLSDDVMAAFQGSIDMSRSGADEPVASDPGPVESIEIPIDEAEPEEDADDDEPMPMRGRAATVALSDEDLEELMEPLDMPAQDRDSAARGPRPARDASLDTRATQPLPIIDESYARELAARGEAISEHAGEPDREPASEPRPSEAPRTPRVNPPEPGVPAAVAALEMKGMESPHDSPLQIGEPSDSGELLSDDLIEEVDDSDVEVESASDVRAAPPPAPPAQSAPPRKPPPAPKSQAKAEVAAKPKRRKGKPWFEEIFDEDYLRTLPFLTPQATQAEAAFVAGALDVEAGSQLLDIGCGYGRHAMELAARGYQVIALDLSLPLLLRGADEAQRRNLNINFVHGDMRELNFDGQFDGAYCLFSTFGYFDDESNKRTMQGIGRSLRPGARLVIEVLNRDYLIEDLPARVWWEGDGCVVLEEVDFNYFSSRIMSNRSVVFDDGRQLEQEISLRAYSLHEFGKLLHGAGFRVIEISGSMATRGRFFGNKSREIIVVAEKRAPREGRAPTQGGAFPRASTAVEPSDA